MKLIALVLLLVTLTWALEVQVVTDKGTIQGFQNNNLFYFLGVPYAKPPLGDLRWKPPMPHDPWTNVLQTTDFASSCIQQYTDGDTFPANISFSEDCLYLNVWATGSTKMKKPVLVWIHGGGLGGGGNSELRLRGEYMSSSADVVVVNINYRLGVLGWLAHPAFAMEDPNHPTTGNYGLLDQRMALSWIQTNIHLFGGDPTDVTIMGESAGGSSVCLHMVTSKSKGLFAKGIIESGSCYSETVPIHTGNQVAMAVQKVLNCQGSVPQILQCMRAVTPDQIIKAQSSVRFASVAVVDGTEVERHPYLTISKGLVNPVPLLSGNVLNEGTLFIYMKRPASQAEYSNYLITSFASLAPLIMAQYPCEQYNASDCWYALTELWGDFLLVCPTMQMADLLKNSSVSNYGYVFTIVPYWGSIKYPGDGAFHSSEIAFVFSTLPSVYPYKPEELVLSHQMTAFWTNFASTGNPNSASNDDGVLVWPSYSAANPRMSLNSPLSIINGWKTGECAFWNSIYEILYAT